MLLRVKAAGRAALRVSGKATVFASFERSCYVENAAGIACLGIDIGLGPLNMLAEKISPVGAQVEIDVSTAEIWTPPSPSRGKIPEIEIPKSIEKPALAFLDWLTGKGEPDDTLIGLGPGLTPAGDDFVGGAMIALRAFGQAGLADRIAAWALPLAAANTNRISRAHLECAAQGEGHEALHDLLTFRNVEKDLARLARIGHTSGTDAASGAIHALAGAHTVM